MDKVVGIVSSIHKMMMIKEEVIKESTEKKANTYLWGPCLEKTRYVMRGEGENYRKKMNTSKNRRKAKRLWAIELKTF